MEASTVILIFIAVVLLMIALKIAKKAIRILLFLGVIAVGLYIAMDYLL